MRAVGIILAGGSNDRLGQLISKRATSAMPIGSCYRTIDFSLSNMTNSSINKVAVITQYNSRSLHDHLSSSKWWDFGRKHGGLFVFTPFLSGDNSFWFRGTADSIFQNLSFLERSNEPYVIIASGDCIYKMDYNKMIDEHVKTDADITIACKDLSGQDVSSYGIMQLDETNRIIDFEEKPIEPSSSIVSLGIYIISRHKLIKILSTILPEARYDFVKDVLVRYRRKLKLQAYFFDGYWKSVNSIKSYYETNMDFLNKDIRNLFTKEYPYISTKPKDEPPAKYNYNAVVKNSLTGSGSILNGVVENSVLFRKVFTADNSIVRNSILMEDAYIGANCRIENAILDKKVVVSDGKQIIGTPDEPIIIYKHSVI